MTLPKHPLEASYSQISSLPSNANQLGSHFNSDLNAAESKESLSE